MKSSEVQSPLFTITIPEDNPFNVTSFINIPQRAISDGYWVEVKGLDPGEHTIEFTGGATAFNFTTHVLYHITIEPTNDNDNNYYDNSIEVIIIIIFIINPLQYFLLT